MSGQDSTSALPSDYSSELHGAAPAHLVSSGGSVRTEATPTTSSSSGADQVPNTVRARQGAVSPIQAHQVPIGGADEELNRRLTEHK